MTVPRETEAEKTAGERVLDALDEARPAPTLDEKWAKAIANGRLRARAEAEGQAEGWKHQLEGLPDLGKLYVCAVLAGVRASLRGILHDIVFRGCAPVLLLALLFAIALRETACSGSWQFAVPVVEPAPTEEPAPTPEPAAGTIARR